MDDAYMRAICPAKMSALLDLTGKLTEARLIDNNARRRWMSEEARGLLLGKIDGADATITHTHYFVPRLSLYSAKEFICTFHCPRLMHSLTYRFAKTVIYSHLSVSRIIC